MLRASGKLSQTFTGRKVGTVLLVKCYLVVNTFSQAIYFNKTDFIQPAAAVRRSADCPVVWFVDFRLYDVMLRLNH